MSKIIFPRMEILRSLSELTADITPNRFISTRPNAVDKQMKEFLLIRLLPNMRDRGDTYQSTKGQIAIFAKDVQGGLENTFALEKMQAAVMNLFPMKTGLFHGKMPVLVPGGSDGAGFHYLIIQFNITIFK